MKHEESIGLEQQIMDLLNIEDGLTDQEITEKLSGTGMAMHTVGNVCRQLAYKGKIKRTRRKGGKLTNHLI